MLIARIMEAGGTLLAVLGLLLQPIAGYGMVTFSCSTCKGANGTHASGAVRIDFDGRGGGLHYYGVSQGTVISGNRLLTHHHYEIPLESLETLTLTLTDVKGNRATVAVNTQTIVAVDAGTTIIPLADIPGVTAGQARPGEVGLTLDAGARVTVVYLDSDGAPGVTELPVYLYDSVTHPGLTSMILKDPGRLIEPGDSGGGVYYGGELIGNLWAIGPAEDGGNYVRVALASER